MMSHFKSVTRKYLNKFFCSFKISNLNFFLQRNRDSTFKVLRVLFETIFFLHHMVCSYGICTLEHGTIPRTTLRHFTETSTWPLLIYPQITISCKKIIFDFHYKKVDLYLVILRLIDSYWMIFCSLVNNYIDEFASATGIPVFI